MCKMASIPDMHHKPTPPGLESTLTTTKIPKEIIDHIDT